jgi:hypothetical protein
MSPLVTALRDWLVQTASQLGCPLRRLNREYGLDDFLNNVVADEDDFTTLAEKAICYFCEDRVPSEFPFQLAVLAVTNFLVGTQPAGQRTRDLVPLAKDLVAVLRDVGANPEQIRNWIRANFP